MRYIKFDLIKDKIDLQANHIVSINFENRDYFFNYYNALKECDEESIQYFDDAFKNINLSKESLFIDSYLVIDLNEKKLLTQLYKDIESRLTNEEIDEYRLLQDQITSFVKKTSYNVEGITTFDEEVSLAKVLNMLDFRFEDVENKDVISKFIKYIKIVNNIRPIKLLITCDFLKYLSENDLILLSEELKLYDISLIDLSYMTDNRGKSIKSISIDADLCEF